MGSRMLSFAFFAVLLGVAAPGHAFKLISDEEARLPSATGGLVTRGITRGPSIKMVSPDVSAGPVKGPFMLKVAFEARGGAKIDASSVRLTYLKSRPVELLDRVKPGLTNNGIELAGAEVPPGEHPIQVTVADSEGRKTTVVFNLVAAQ